MAADETKDGQTRTRVLFAIPSLGRGGPDRVFYDLMRGFDRARFQPVLATSSQEGFFLDRLPEDVPVHTVSNDQGVFGRYPVLGLARAVRRTRPQAVIATLRMVMTAGLAKPLMPRGTRLILRVANQPSDNFAALQKDAPVKHRVSHWVMRRALLAADHIVCQSADMARDVNTLLENKVPVSVIGNPIDLDHVYGLVGEEPETLPGHPSVLCVARLMPQKGVDVLLEAFALLRDRKPTAHLTLIGEGPAQADLEARARHLGIDKAVTFRGFVENPYPMMAGADLFALASRYEGFPNVVIEALACGTPVVATDCPGATRDILKPEEGGFLAPPENAPRFAKVMVQALGEVGNLRREEIAAACGQRHALASVVAAYEALCSAGES